MNSKTVQPLPSKRYQMVGQSPFLTIVICGVSSVSLNANLFCLHSPSTWLLMSTSADIYSLFFFSVFHITVSVLKSMNKNIEQSSMLASRILRPFQLT